MSTEGVVEIDDKSSRYMGMQSRFDKAKAWAKILAKLDHLTDRGPQVYPRNSVYLTFRLFQQFVVIQSSV